jgi:hypothetical protein
MLGLAWLENPGRQTGSLGPADLPKNLVKIGLVGLVGLLDPPRKEAIEAVAECHAGGIRVTMITGDHRITVAAIAKMLGIGDGKTAMIGDEIKELNEAQLQEAVRKVDVFARTSPGAQAAPGQGGSGEQTDLRHDRRWRERRAFAQAGRDGTTHLVLSPLEFMQRLAAPVPRQRLQLIRYHGMLAPNATLRARVVPQGQAARGPAACAAGEIRGEAQPVQDRAKHIGWALLLARVFDIDLRRCPGCGAEGAEDHRGDPAAGGVREDPTRPGLDPRPPLRGRASRAGHVGPAVAAG